MKIRLTFSLCLMFFTLIAVSAEVVKQGDEPKWWEKRRQRADIFFPHNAHQEIMKNRGDVCMACHPFSGTKLTDLKMLSKLETLSNEPLEAICHECHVAERSAPIACEYCHPDTSTIRPEDHAFDYKTIHGEAAIQDQVACRLCHLDLSFCTDCHFRRNSPHRVNHPLGYRDRHGLEARMDPATCGSCHNAGYCRECHRGGNP